MANMIHVTAMGETVEESDPRAAYQVNLDNEESLNFIESLKAKQATPPVPDEESAPAPKRTVVTSGRDTKK